MCTGCKTGDGGLGVDEFPVCFCNCIGLRFVSLVTLLTWTMAGGLEGGSSLPWCIAWVCFARRRGVSLAWFNVILCDETKHGH